MAADSKRVDVNDALLSRPAEIRVGTIIDGKFEITGLLGRGGFASVYAARQASLNRAVAIKVLDPSRSDANDMESLGRFAQEARAAALIDHANIVTVFDTGVLDSGQPFIAMKLVQGHDLSVELRAGPLTVERALRLFDGALAALARAHDLGIVHRDLKPSNLLLSFPGSSDEQLLVVDFGIARVDYEVTSELTGTNQVLGSLGFIAPEYLDGQTVSPALDVYQMGLILAEAVSGFKAFGGADIQRLHRIMRGEMQLDPALLETSLGKVILKAVEFDASSRWPDAGAFREALQQLDPASIDYGPAGAAAVSPQAVASPSGSKYAFAETLDTMSGLDTLSGLDARVADAGPSGEPTPAAISARASAPGFSPAPAPALPSPSRGTADLDVPAARSAKTRRLWYGAVGSVGLVATIGLGLSIGVGPDRAASPEKPSDGTLKTEIVAAPDAAGAELVAVTGAPVGHSDLTDLVPAEADLGNLPVDAPVAEQTGTLSVTARPGGVVIVDGEDTGKTTPLTDYSLVAGRHTVQVRSRNGLSEPRIVEIVAGMSKSVKFKRKSAAAAKVPPVREQPAPGGKSASKSKEAEGGKITDIIIKKPAVELPIPGETHP